MKSLKMPCDVMTRTVGYFAVVRQMNAGIKEQVKDRYKYHEADVIKALEAKPRSLRAITI